MALSDELTALLAHAGPDLLKDANSFGAALDDYLPHEVASRGTINLLVDAVRQGSVDRLRREIAQGADPARAVQVCGDQLARDRGTSESASTRWAVAILGFATGVVDRGVLAAQTAPPSQSTPPLTPPRTPPVAPPPLAPTHARPAHQPPGHQPPAHQPPTHHPYGHQPAPRRTGLIIGAVVAAVALIGGGITAVVLLQDDLGSDRPIDSRPSTLNKVSEEPSETGSTDGPTGTADPEENEATLLDISKVYLPSGGTPEVTARSWSVAADNLDGGTTRDLGPDERDQATEWRVRTPVGDYTYNVVVEQEPSDGGAYYDWDCDDFVSNGPIESECAEFQTRDDRTALDYWYYNSDLGSVSHQVVVPADTARGLTQVIVGERKNEAVKSSKLADLKGGFQLSSDELREILQIRRLNFPPPAVLPPLPSYGYCILTDPRPTECPDDLV